MNWNIWQACLKNIEINLELLNNIDMLQITEKWIRRGICPIIDRYSKANNKCIQDYNKDKESSYLMYCNAHTLYELKMSQILSENNLELEKNINIRWEFSKRL